MFVVAAALAGISERQFGHFGINHETIWVWHTIAQNASRCWLLLSAHWGTRGLCTAMDGTLVLVFLLRALLVQPAC
jgi:hypothetical protein